MVKVKYEKFSNLENLEFKFFKELNIGLLEPVKIEIGVKFNNLFSGYGTPFDFLIVLKLIDNKTICGDDNKFYLFDNVLNLKEGEIICLKEDDEIFRIEKDIFNEKFLNECHKKLEDIYGKLDEDMEIKNNILKKEDIEKEVEKIIKKTKRNKLERLKEEKEEEEKEKDKNYKKKKFEKESIFKSKRIEVDKKIIQIKDIDYAGDNTHKIILTKNVNEIFDYDFINGYCVTSQEIKEKLIEKEEGFTFYQNNKKIYELKYETNKKEEIIKSLEEKDYYSKVKINDIRIRRNKISVILDRIDEKTTKNEIKLWNKFAKKQLDLMNLKEFSVEDIPIKIDISYCSIDLFIVNLFGKKEKLTWDDLNKIFFKYGRSIYSYLTIPKFIEFSQKFGFTKQEVYDKLKQLSEKK